LHRHQTGRRRLVTPAPDSEPCQSDPTSWGGGDNVRQGGGNRALVEQLWETLYRRDFVGVGALFAADGEYTDMPTPADDVARGPAQVAARLRLGLEPLAAISHTVRTIVAEGDT